LAHALQIVGAEDVRQFFRPRAVFPTGKLRHPDVAGPVEAARLRGGLHRAHAQGVQLRRERSVRERRQRALGHDGERRRGRDAALCRALIAACRKKRDDRRKDNQIKNIQMSLGSHTEA
jgi:hypothetical protein